MQGCLGAVPSPRASSSPRARYEIPPVLPDMLPLLPCSSSSSSLPCLLRVVRSFRICWIARRFFFPFFFCFLKSSGRDRPGGLWQSARTRKRVDFQYAVRMNRRTEEMQRLVIIAFSGPRTLRFSRTSSPFAVSTVR